VRGGEGEGVACIRMIVWFGPPLLDLMPTYQRRGFSCPLEVIYSNRKTIHSLGTTITLNPEGALPHISFVNYLHQPLAGP